MGACDLHHSGPVDLQVKALDRVTNPATSGKLYATVILKAFWHRPHLPGMIIAGCSYHRDLRMEGHTRNGLTSCRFGWKKGQLFQENLWLKHPLSQWLPCVLWRLESWKIHWYTQLANQKWWWSLVSSCIPKMPDYLANKACHCTMASLQTQPRARLQSWSWCTDSSLNRVEHNLDAKCCVRNGSDASQSPGVLSSLGHGASRRVFFLRSNSSLSVKSFRL